MLPPSPTAPQGPFRSASSLRRGPSAKKTGAKISGVKGVRRASGAAGLAAALTFAAFGGLAACAGGPHAPAPPSQAAGAADVAPLETVRASLTSLEDSLVLDLLLGYRARTEGGGDAETLRRARSAQNQLDYMLRRGGVKSRGGEARVIAVDDDRLTLEETVNQLSAALMRHTAGTAWRPEAERAREVQRRRPELSALVEDAEWVLSLAAALDGPLPDNVKAGLRRLHERYAARAPHTDITAQVNALLALPAVSDESLRRELKKLANRSWERERRGPAASAVRAPRQESRAPAPAAPAPPSLPDPAPTPSPVADSVSPPADAPETALDALVTPERFCAERRADAAQSFALARAAADTGAREGHLRHSLKLLDECIARYPGSPEAAKAAQNRDRVEQELKR